MLKDLGHLCCRYVEAVTPLLAQLHPSTLVDGLHAQCSNAVKAQNKLKKKSSHSETVERHENGESNIQQSNGDASGTQSSKTSRMQVMFSLSKVNLMKSSLG